MTLVLLGSLPCQAHDACGVSSTGKVVRGSEFRSRKFFPRAPSSAFDKELRTMAAHLMNEADLFTAPRVRLSGPNYRGQHRSAVYQQVGQPGTLVLEPASQVPSRVIGQIAAVPAVVRPVGPWDAHAVAFSALHPSPDATRARGGPAFGSSW